MSGLNVLLVGLIIGALVGPVTVLLVRRSWRSR